MDRDSVFVAHILDAIGTIEKYLTALDLHDFLKPEKKMVQDAVVRQLEIIGEATKNLSDDFKDRHHEIPWRKASGMRNSLIHEYFGVDFKIVWATAKNDLPKLKKQLLALEIKFK